MIGKRILLLPVISVLAGCADPEVTAFSCEQRGSLTENGMGSPVPVAETTFVLDKRRRALFQVSWTDDLNQAPGFIPLSSCCRDFRVTEKSITGSAAGTRLLFDRAHGTGMFHLQGVGDATYSHCQSARVPKNYWTDPDFGSNIQLR